MIIIINDDCNDHHCRQNHNRHQHLSRHFPNGNILSYLWPNARPFIADTPKSYNIWHIWFSTNYFYHCSNDNIKIVYSQDMFKKDMIRTFFFYLFCVVTIVFIRWWVFYIWWWHWHCDSITIQWICEIRLASQKWESCNQFHYPSSMSRFSTGDSEDNNSSFWLDLIFIS